MREYPEDYKGPKAGQSSNEEWFQVTPFQAFKYMRDFTWLYSDFDCWLSAMNDWHYNRGNEDAVKAFEEMQKIIGVRS
jgi:hypothetical protein